MKILVTGGTGYIGSHTVVELQDSGYEVLIIDNLSNSHLEVIDNIAAITGIRPGFEKLDLTDGQALDRILGIHDDLSAVIHFAAFKAVAESVDHPLKYYQNNLRSTLNLLQALINHHIVNFVFSSSCTVYGQPDALPVKENSPLKQALSPYGHTKQISEEIIINASIAHELEGIILRYFNPIGAHQSAMIGELPIGIPNNLVPYLTQTAIGKRDYLRVFGNDYDTPDGTPIRDYIHVVDLARAHVRAVERLLKNKNKKEIEIFNLGTGSGFSVLEVIKSFEKVSGVALNYRVTQRRPGDIEKVWADASLANRELGWSTERDLDEMMLSAWNWEKMLDKKSKNPLSTKG